MILKQFRYETLGQASYLVGCVRSKEAIVVDPIAEGRGMTPAEVAAAQQSGAVLLDMRLPRIFAKAHVPGAVNLQFNRADLADRADMALSRDPAYLVHAEPEAIAKVAVDLMREAGFNILGHLEGGLAGWRAAGLPIGWRRSSQLARRLDPAPPRPRRQARRRGDGRLERARVSCGEGTTLIPNFQGRLTSPRNGRDDHDEHDAKNSDVANAAPMFVLREAPTSKNPQELTRSRGRVARSSRDLLNSCSEVAQRSTNRRANQIHWKLGIHAFLSHPRRDVRESRARRAGRTRISARSAATSIRAASSRSRRRTRGALT